MKFVKIFPLEKTRYTVSDANLESILWNKVPYAIQREVGEMKEWTLNELFQRLLKAESRVMERERCRQEIADVSPQEESKKNTRRHHRGPGTAGTDQLQKNHDIRRRVQSRPD